MFTPLSPRQATGYPLHPQRHAKAPGHVGHQQLKVGTHNFNDKGVITTVTYFEGHLRVT